MVAVPGPGGSPVTIPVAEPTVATPGLLLLHIPPDVASLKGKDEPAHTDVGPVIDAGGGLTVTVVVAMQVDIA
jgi:hypothetical protein